MLPGPRVFDPDKKMDKVVARSDHILAVMLKGQMLTEEQYLAALAEVPSTFYAGEEQTPHGEDATQNAEAGRENGSGKFGEEPSPTVEDLREETGFDSHPFTEEKPIVEIPVATPE
jgi:membrane peptidoglycan carboxypeptidase